MHPVYLARQHNYIQLTNCNSSRSSYFPTRQSIVCLCDSQLVTERRRGFLGGVLLTYSSFIFVGVVCCIGHSCIVHSCWWGGSFVFDGSFSLPNSRKLHHFQSKRFSTFRAFSRAALRGQCGSPPCGAMLTGQIAARY